MQGLRIERSLWMEERFTQAIIKRVVSMDSLHRGTCTMIP